MSLRRSLLAITFAILALITFVGCLGGKAGDSGLRSRPLFLCPFTLTPPLFFPFF